MRLQAEPMIGQHPARWP